MDSKGASQTQIHDFKPERERFRVEVLSGLGKTQKELPSKYFYDERGSHLYERICTLDEYYLTRTEAAIMYNHIGEIVELLGPNACLVEYGCGNCAKTLMILDHLLAPVAFVPIDISREQLLHVTGELASSYSGLDILPVCADTRAVLSYPLRTDRVTVS